MSGRSLVNFHLAIFILTGMFALPQLCSDNGPRVRFDSALLKFFESTEMYVSFFYPLCQADKFRDKLAVRFEHTRRQNKGKKREILV